MKKVIFTLAIAGMFGFVACNNNTEAVDSAAIADSIAAVEAAAQAEAEAAAAAAADTVAVEAVAEETAPVAE